MEAKTPALHDKRLWLAVGTIVSLLLAAFLKIQVEAEMLATIALTVVGYITNSAMKEAAVAKAVVAAEAVKTEADAAAVLQPAEPPAAP